MNTNENNFPGRATLLRSRAFTLIEMITVITIMAIVAALVVTMGKTATDKKKRAQVDADKNKLLSHIAAYYNKLNYYPPDNGALATNPPGPIYDGLAATNPLIYELFGATNTNGGNNLIVFNSPNSSATLSTNSYGNVFNRTGVGNGDSAEPHNFFQPGPSPKEFTNYASAAATGSLPICGLVVPVEFTNVQIPNFWHYDSSSTNRHNLNSFDLWAEFTIGNKNGHPIIITNGNW